MPSTLRTSTLDTYQTDDHLVIYDTTNDDAWVRANQHAVINLEDDQ